MAAKRILIIDDERKLCQMIKQRLESEGTYAVEITHSGREGIESALTKPTDLVILDFSLPDMDGGSVLEAIKNARPQLPVVLFSIYFDDPAVIPAQLLSKASGVIGKPLKRNELLETIERLLPKVERNK